MMKENIIEQYTFWLAERENADNTIKAYLKSLNHFIDYFETNVEKPIHFDLILPSHLISWKNRLVDEEYIDGQRYAPSTVNNFIESLRPFFNFLIDIGIIAKSPMLNLKKLKIQDDENVRWLIDAEEENLKYIVDHKQIWRGFNQSRNRAMFYFMLYAGLRISEVVNLNVNDIENGYIHIRNSKGQKYRTIYMSKALADIYTEYIAERKIKNPSGAALFISQKNGRITTSGVNKIINKLAEQANYPFFTAHTLRHTCAHNLLKNGATLIEVSNILGHNSIQTTSIYTKSSKAEQAKALERITKK